MNRLGPRKALLFAALLGALGLAEAAFAGDKDDRRDKAKEAKELAEKAQQYAISKAQEYFAQQQYDKGMQEIGQAMQDMQSSQKNQKAKQDTNGAGKKGSGDGRGRRNGESVRETASAPATIAPISSLDERLQAPSTAPPKRVLPSENGSPSDEGRGDTASNDPIDARSPEERKPSEEFVASLRELRADIPHDAGNRKSGGPPLEADGKVTFGPAGGPSDTGLGATDTRRGESGGRYASANDGSVFLGRGGSSGGSVLSGNIAAVGEEEEVDEKKIYRVKKKKKSARGVHEDDDLDDDHMPPARAQIVDPKQLSQIAKAAR